MFITKKKYDEIIADYESKLQNQATALNDVTASKEALIKKYDEIIADYESKLQSQATALNDITASKEALLEKYGRIINEEEEFQNQLSAHAEEKEKHNKIIEGLLAREKALDLEYKTALETYEKLKNTINLYDSKLDLMEYGVYEPIYSFDTPEAFKDAIETVQEKQKDLISNKQAAVCLTTWTVDGSKAKGTSMINKEIKLILRAFNGECDSIISKLRWNNVGRCKNKIQDIYDRMNKLGSANKVEITEEYLSSKLEELDLYYGLANLNYSIKMQERTLREERREEERAQRELEQERIRAEREEIHYQAALAKVRAEIEHATGVKYDQLAEKIKYYEEELAEARANKERAISMAQQTRRGYVYIISNIGSFGENVYKIGMTRRLDPEDRIRELSNASVPFRFDIHAMIYSEDAPSLETMLHNAFDGQKLNLVNGRKEFFRIPLEEIEKRISESGISAKFIAIPEARDYRESERIRNEEVTIEEVEKEFPESLFDADEE